MKKYLLLLALVITGCSGPFFPAPTLQTIKIDPTTSTYHVGTLQPLVATGFYSDGSVKDLTKQVQWASSDRVVLDCDGVGTVLAHAVGNATVTATKDNVTGTLAITVEP